MAWAVGLRALVPPYSSFGFGTRSVCDRATAYTQMQMRDADAGGPPGATLRRRSGTPARFIFILIVEAREADAQMLQYSYRKDGRVGDGVGHYGGPDQWYEKNARGARYVRSATVPSGGGLKLFDS
ncbi:hypothetical protein HYFRA_00007393 [Hymenoscyphus fraxineus]|uniref:Uncharacterized protein n=1 Tax=Hymenoscyphus fraxineus TaxID=746836 RepID=A0A9N9KTX4_9HELO|nr:hypothetical protein HYFRA_00007393 [Hymenoscyphus fraxineus]